MTHAARLAPVVGLGSCLLTGCLASTVALHVKSDGSGTAVASLRVNKATYEQFWSTLGQPAAVGRPEDSYPAPDNAALTAFFGSRVTLVKSTQTPNAEGFTRETVVAFDDVTKLVLACPPLVDTMSPSHGFHSASVGNPVIRFAIRPHENGDRLLVVQMPDGRIEQQPHEITPERPRTPAEEQEQAMFKRAARGAAARLFVELEAPLLRTNAPARDGNRVTILDLDFEKMLESAESDKSVPPPTPLSVQELLWGLGDMTGAIVPTDHEVFLEFEAPAGDAPPQASARQAPPDTEIYLASLTISGGQPTIGQPVNISTSPGYDNQPSFTPDGQRILFTSARDGTQTDIYRFDLSTKHITQLTHTPESEYSPGTSPDGRLSVVRVEADGTQRLWGFTSDGRDPRVLLERVKPVGYYAWADDHTVALYVLGAAGTDQPSTLQLADTRTGDARSIAVDVGRSLLTIPGRRAVSFVQRERNGDKSSVTIAELDPSSGAIRPLAPALEGATEADGAWMPDGTLLTVSQDRLLAWRQGDREWTEVAPLDRLGLRSATRLAVSPDGHWIALVAAPPQ